MFPKFVAASTKLLLAAGWLALMTTSWCVAPAALAQEEPEAESPAPETKPQDEPKLPVEVRMKRLVFKYETEVSFLLPEGEFDAALEKKIGHFATQTRARYNFLRGEMGFSLQNAYTRFNLVPQAQVFDRLHFVPVFEEEKSKDRVWRREQGFQFGTRMFFIQPINALTSFNYQRYSFPSTVNRQDLDTQQVHSIGQSLGVQADSSHAFGFYHSGLFDVEVVRAFPFGRNRSDFWQIRLTTRGVSENAWFSVSGEASLVSLIDGRAETVPRSFLGGRNRLSAYDTNEFSGINFFHVSQANRLHLNKTKPLDLVRGFSLYESNLVLHTEVGQIGRHFSPSHVSVGLGFSGIAAYHQRRAFELFFFIYKALENDRKPKYYFGVKY